MNKIDIHVHCAPQRFALPATPWQPDANYVAEPDEIKHTLRAQGIGHAVLMSSGEAPEGSPYTLGAYNGDCAAIAAADPAYFSWMCAINPAEPATVYDRLAACKENGAVGVGEIMINQWLDSPFLSEVFSAAEKLGLPILCHMSPEPGFSYGVCDRPGLPLLEQALQRHPGLKWIGHSQLFWLEISGDCPRSGNAERSGMGRGPVAPGGRLGYLLKTYPNLYADLSAYSGSCAILRDEEYGLRFLHTWADRLLFGTDTTNQHTVFPLGNFLDNCLTDGRLSEADHTAICRGNAQALLGIA